MVIGDIGGPGQTNNPIPNPFLLSLWDIISQPYFRFKEFKINHLEPRYSRRYIDFVDILLYGNLNDTDILGAIFHCTI